MRIKKLIETSLIDWEGMIISTLYVGGCNFRCPFCYNTDLVINQKSLPTIPEEEVFSFLDERKSFLDGICLSGGEPTCYDDLPEFLKKIKNNHLKIKLDTNGSYPEKLSYLIDQGLLDYIAMDIKNHLQYESYARTIGIQDKGIIDKVKESIDLIIHCGSGYEFRTTVIPGFHDQTRIEDIAKYINGAQKYVLQNFIQSEKMLDSCLNEVTPYPIEKMEEMKKKIEPYVKCCQIR